MQALFLCNEYPPAPHGGIGSAVRDLTVALAARGVRVTAVGCYHDAELKTPCTVETRDGVRVIRLRIDPGRMNWMIQALYTRLKLYRWLKKEYRRDPFLFLETTDYDGWMPLRFPLCPVTTRLHGSNMLYDNLLGRQTEKLVTRLERMHLRRTQYCIGVSDFVLEATGKLVDLSDKTRHVVYNCVDTQHFCPSQGGRPAEQSIVFVNSLNQRKGLDALFQAMPDVLNQFPDVVLKLAGRGDEAYIEHLMGLIDSRFHKNIQFLGFVPRQDLPALLRQATLCCYPSLAETFGIAPVEAMAVGLPVIYTNLGPGPEILEHEVSGLLTDPRDPADIARQIKRILGNPEFARRIAANGRERVQEKFSTEIWLENNLNFYRDQVAVDFQLAGLRDPS